jgi:hypothetical protein
LIFSSNTEKEKTNTHYIQIVDDTIENLVDRDPDNVFAVQEVADGCTTGLDIEKLECKVLRTPRTRVTVTHRRPLSSAAIVALERHPHSGGLLKLMAIVHSVWIY